MKAIEANEYFDPATSPFETLGFFETFLEGDHSRVLGNRRLDVVTAPRPLAYAGKQELVLTAPLRLRRGLSEVEIPASLRKPRKVVSMLYVLCGRLKRF